MHQCIRVYGRNDDYCPDHNDDNHHDHNDDYRPDPNDAHLYRAGLMPCSFKQAGHPHCQVAHLVLRNDYDDDDDDDDDGDMMMMMLMMMIIDYQ